MSLVDTQPRATTNGNADHNNMRYLDAVSLALTDITKNARVTVYDGTDTSGTVLATLAVSPNTPSAFHPVKVASNSGTVHTTIVDSSTGTVTNAIARVMLFTH